MATWYATAPNAFTLSTASDSATDLTTSADGRLFAMRAHNSAEIRGPDLGLFSTPATAEVEPLANRVAVPGVAMHPSGALIYDPFLDGPAPASPPATGTHGRIAFATRTTASCGFAFYLPEAIAMLNTA